VFFAPRAAKAAKKPGTKVAKIVFDISFSRIDLAAGAQKNAAAAWA